ncbi:MAG: phosphate acyltransferase PlsX [Abditibacteriota bacterium]|nr:phosphate acyltransferase PlsX [Abditibacteriota bacterium]
MLIAVDAMGGDYAPAEIVKGAIMGSRLWNVDIVLVGDEKAIQANLPASYDKSRIKIKHASEVIAMGDHVDAVRTKRDASLVVAASMVKSGEADAVISLGNTAAAMAAGTLCVGRIRGIMRPAITLLLPTGKGVTVFLDVGAVADCTPGIMCQFALMGKVYSETVLGTKSPRVGLLSIGEEASKGNEVTKATHEILVHTENLNFIGNVEGRNLFDGTADIIVADGFVGNVALKVAEGVMEHMKSLLKEDLGNHPLSYVPMFMLSPLLKRIKKKFDYSEYGGAPLLGLNGVFIVGHGRSNAHAVSNAVKAAKRAVEGNVVEAIRDAVSRQ